MAVRQRAVEGVVVSRMPHTDFWADRRVLVTGHTGFKGSWLSLWLHSMGARVTGLALPPPTSPSLFERARVDTGMQSILGDIRDQDQVQAAFAAARPEVVFHLAAQPLVRYSYEAPVETYSTNVMGTVHVLDAARHSPGLRAVVNITSDKCYDNREWAWGYRENDTLGGYDPYSNSKGCAEMVTAAYRNAFFNAAADDHHAAVIASVRAGNVIGGGDWAQDRLIPDILRAIGSGGPVRIRNPHAIRPWQHVLEPLAGYLMLAERLVDEGSRWGKAWNFGPGDADARSVEWIVGQVTQLWGEGARWEPDTDPQAHEARYLRLDCSRARQELGWKPRWDLRRALHAIVDWHRQDFAGSDLRTFTLRQIADYLATETVD